MNRPVAAGPGGAAASPAASPAVDPAVDPSGEAAERGARARARLADAARLLPFLGAVLFLVPDLVLSEAPAAAGATLPWLTYLFAVWLGLIGLAAWVAWRHRVLGRREAGRAAGRGGAAAEVAAEAAGRAR